MSPPTHVPLKEQSNGKVSGGLPDPTFHPCFQTAATYEKPTSSELGLLLQDIVSAISHSLSHVWITLSAVKAFPIAKSLDSPVIFWFVFIFYCDEVRVT